MRKTMRKSSKNAYKSKKLAEIFSENYPSKTEKILESKILLTNETNQRQKSNESPTNSINKRIYNPQKNK